MASHLKIDPAAEHGDELVPIEGVALGLSKSAVRRWWRGDMGELVKVEKFLMLMGLELRVVRGRKLEDRLRDIGDE